MKCPSCNTEVQSRNINIQTDVAQCQNCNRVFKISAVLAGSKFRGYSNFDGFDLNNPPNGAWIRAEMKQLVIGVTTRSPVAFFLVPFMVIWSAGSIGGIYGTQLVSGKFNLLISLFGIPFLIGAVVFWNLALMAIWGKVELTLDKYGGRIFTGIGKIGRTKKFTWDEIVSVREEEIYYRGSYRGGKILLEGKRRISFGMGFGMGIKGSRRYYLFRALEQIIAKVKANKNFI